MLEKVRVQRQRQNRTWSIERRLSSGTEAPAVITSRGEPSLEPDQVAFFVLPRFEARHHGRRPQA